MEKLTVKDLAMFLGCEVDFGISAKNGGEKVSKLTPLVLWYISKDTEENKPTHFNLNYCSEIKPILRPLSDMTEEECKHILWFNLDSEKHLEKDSRITIDEIDFSIIRPDGGLNVDLDAAVVIDLSCRCFTGQLVVRTNGDIELWNDDSEKLPIERQVENVIFLISKHFDVFGWIEKGLAIDKLKLTTPKGGEK